MLLSAIVPVYNVGEYLDTCLRSLLDQDLAPDEYEIIVIDDGATDGSLSIARAFAAEDTRLKIHSQANQGVSAARNTGLDVAIGDYVFFVDGDDYVASGVLGPLVRIIREHQLEILGFGFLNVQPGEIVRETHQPTDISPVINVVEGIDFMAHNQYRVLVWQYIFDRRFLERVGVRFEVGRYLQDGTFTAAVLASARRMAVIPWDVVRYVHRPESTMRDRSDEHAARIVADFERNVFSLDELRQRTVADASATPEFLARLHMRQESYAFFLIARFIRSRLPIRPLLPEMLSRLRGVGAYPFATFPDQHHPGLQLRMLTVVFNRGYLLYPFASVYRAVDSVRVRLAR